MTKLSSCCDVTARRDASHCMQWNRTEQLKTTKELEAVFAFYMSLTPKQSQTVIVVQCIYLNFSQLLQHIGLTQSTFRCFFFFFIIQNPKFFLVFANSIFPIILISHLIQYAFEYFLAPLYFMVQLEIFFPHFFKIY